MLQIFSLSIDSLLVAPYRANSVLCSTFLGGSGRPAYGSIFSPPYRVLLVLLTSASYAMLPPCLVFTFYNQVEVAVLSGSSFWCMVHQEDLELQAVPRFGLFILSLLAVVCRVAHPLFGLTFGCFKRWKTQVPAFCVNDCALATVSLQNQGTLVAEGITLGWPTVCQCPNRPVGGSIFRRWKTSRVPQWTQKKD